MVDTLKKMTSALLSAPGMSLGLDNMRSLLGFLRIKAPTHGYIHITGTNGKGSTAAFTAAILTENGYRTGLYTSPSVADFAENIVLDGVSVDEKTLISAANAVFCAAKKMSAHPTRFELETAMAFWIFAGAGCDFVVLEVGLGGRLDATNIVEKTLVAAFTPISVDHEKVLGSSSEAIAVQKSGIIKRGCRVVSAPQTKSVAEVLTAKAREAGCPICFVSALESVCFDGEVETFRRGGSVYQSRMLGLHQATNLAVALGIIDVLAELGFAFDSGKTAAATILPQLLGRFQAIGKRPQFFLDGAHNRAAARMLVENIRRYRSGGGKVLVIFGIFSDKDADGVIAELLTVADRFFTFDWSHPRAFDGSQLCQKILNFGGDALYCEGTQGATAKALAAAGAQDFIVACGSFSHLAKIKACYVRGL